VRGSFFGDQASEVIGRRVNMIVPERL